MKVMMCLRVGSAGPKCAGRVEATVVLCRDGMGRVLRRARWSLKAAGYVVSKGGRLCWSTTSYPDLYLWYVDTSPGRREAGVAGKA